MAFVLSLLYLISALLSPSALPDVFANLRPNLILGVLVLLALIPELPASRLFSLPEPFLVFGVLLACVVSTLATGWFGHVVTIVTDFIPIVATFYFVAVSCQSLRRLKLLATVLAGVAIFVIIQGVLAENSGDLTSHYLLTEIVSTGTIYRHRGLGMLNDPNDFAQLLVMVLPLLWIRWRKGALLANVLLTLMPAAMLAFGIYSTHSRGAIVAVLAVLLFGFKDKLGLVFTTVLAGAAAAAMFALNLSGGRGINDDDGNRIGLWSAGLTDLKTHPFFGIGMNNFADLNGTGLTAHNSYVLCLAELGVFGYLFWMGMIVAAWSGLSRIMHANAGAAPSAEPEAATSLPSYDRPLAPLARRQMQMMGVMGTAGTPAIAGAAPQARIGTAIHTPFMDSSAYAAPKSTTVWSPSLPKSSQTSATPAEFARIALLLRTSLVGLLTAAYFLSRTYSIALYLSLGMIAAFELIDRDLQPEAAEGMRPLSWGSLLKRIALVMAGSIVFLYLFVRLRSSHG